MSSAIHQELKTVGKSGQISLGKSYAGKVLRVERHDNGTIVLTAVAVIPESQLWTLAEPHRSAIARGMAWAAGNPPRESDPDLLLEQAQHSPGNSARGKKS
jgi:hypothetical protein